MFPIKYIENNLVFNHDGECFAYYELTPYNYSFLSPEEKYMVHDNFRQLIAQNRDGKIHALQIATEDSLRAVQERSKKGITGRLKEIACKKVDEQTEALVEMIGERPDRDGKIYDSTEAFTSQGAPMLCTSRQLYFNC